MSSAEVQRKSEYAFLSRNCARSASPSFGMFPTAYPSSARRLSTHTALSNALSPVAFPSVASTPEQTALLRKIASFLSAFAFLRSAIHPAMRPASFSARSCTASCILRFTEPPRNTGSIIPCNSDISKFSAASWRKGAGALIHCSFVK